MTSNSSTKTIFRKYSTQIAGGSAGGVAAVITCPFDVLKIRLQVQRGGVSHYNSGLWAMVKTIFLEEGYRGFFAGLSPTVLGLVPTYSIYFSTYSYFKCYYSNNNGIKDGPLLHLISAVSAASLTDICTNPLWVIKTRLQTQILRPDLVPYRGIFDCVRRMVREEGMRSLYKGLVPQLMGIAHVGIQFPAYEAIKTKIKKSNEGEALSVPQLMFAAGFSKIIAAIGAYPHEVLRAKFQFQHTGEIKYVGLINTIKIIIREEGIRGLYKGLTPNILRVIPATAISFTSFEILSGYLNQN